MKNYLFLLAVIFAALCSCNHKDSVAPSNASTLPDTAQIIGRTDEISFNFTEGIQNTHAEAASFISRNGSDTSEAIYEFTLQGDNGSFALDFLNLRDYNLKTNDTSLEAAEQLIRPGTYSVNSDSRLTIGSSVFLGYSDGHNRGWVSQFGPQKNSFCTITSAERSRFHGKRALKVKLIFACILYDGQGLSRPASGSAQVYFLPARF